MAEQQKPFVRPQGLRRDDFIMGTNSSSITSKRSVERLYFPNEPQYFQHFVKKPHRRSPLINRGYWLRMQAIDFVVRQFLQEASKKPKIIVNLGCGFDPLPWQCLSRYPKLCKGAKFVDIDYESLMIKKCDIVNQTQELKVMLTNLSSGNGPLLLRSDEYVQIACDLRDLTRLNTALSSVFNSEECLVLFCAEVSITYMNVIQADALIHWAATFPDARFCLLEQILPQGPLHPFAKTMLGHFNKLQTPLGSVLKYPTTADQARRFDSAGWANVRAVNLWELWASSDLEFLTPKQRISLGEVEAFDEWEEFALFACHYFLLLAANGIPSSSSLLKAVEQSQVLPPTIANKTQYQTQSQKSTSFEVESIKSSFTEYRNNNGCRRFGMTLPLRSSHRRQDVFGAFSGMGLNSRLDSIDAYAPLVGPLETPIQLFYQNAPSEAPSSRMCHTITDMGDIGAFLTGGRCSPNNALADCWLYHKWTNVWERVDDLPTPRYRHAAVSLGNGKVMVVGGKTDSIDIATDILVWDRPNGWMTVQKEARGSNLKRHPSPRFGAILSTTSQTQKNLSKYPSGLLAGGMSQDGVILCDAWLWSLEERDGNRLILCFEEISCGEEYQCTASLILGLARFGAATINYAGRIVIVGGVGRNSLLADTDEFISVDMPSCGAKLVRHLLPIGTFDPRPLLIGVSISSTESNLLITGGGAVCFSFGTFWNKGCYSIALRQLLEDNNCHCYNLPQTWRYLKTVKTIPPSNPISIPDKLLGGSTDIGVQLFAIERAKITTQTEFAAIVAAGRPFILEGLDLGTCTERWSNSYLKERIGSTKQVIVHKAAQEQMSFTSKNFEYVPMSVGKFLDAIDAGEKLYLRSLSTDRPSELPTDLARDFPAIAADFKLPIELKLVTENAHSSPLRVSGPVNMWLHYDVMANVLCQVRGSKRLLLFPPGDAQFLDLAAGASSSGLDVFKMLYDSKLGHLSPHEAVLTPGDVLFIPNLWFHAASPTEGISVAVNIFFKTLHNGYAPGRDVYGNRDLQAYEKGRQDVARIRRSFDNLPLDVRHFYLHRLAKELALSA